ncbi:hypothetical protein Athai_13470 [Actinocatenispora thailandica]|uniref:H repeat-associated protein N-terminal domain-containing protein n=1 Tax=Actinocatenispora thailandica TaxID=227318 RepID=A0A7R7HWC9_9ACTN|nr:hypothetical protein Athai_13470 [Actinocatenispora thailandica]
MPALSSSLAPCPSPDPGAAVDATGKGGGSPLPSSVVELLGRVADPRKRRGVRHRVGAVLAVALAATVAGARSFAGIAE